MLAQYQENMQVTGVHVSSGSGGNKWLTLTLGFVKINFDGAVFRDSNMSSIEVVIRNNNRAILASCLEKITQAYKADEIEALVALKALSFVHELVFRSAILEGDSLGLIQALKSEVYTLS